MKKGLALIALMGILLLPFVVAQRESCPDYCGGSTYYSRGAYSIRTQQCEYELTRCAYGCADRTRCASAPASERIITPTIPEYIPPSIPIETYTPTIPTKFVPGDKDKDGIDDFNDICPELAAATPTGCPACQIDTDGANPDVIGEVGNFKPGPFSMVPMKKGLPTGNPPYMPVFFLQDKCTNPYNRVEYSCAAQGCLSKNDLWTYGDPAIGLFTPSDATDFQGYACVLNPATGKGTVVAKAESCECGCEDAACLPEEDTDGDKNFDCNDLDDDNDGIPDDNDNCPWVKNPALIKGKQWDNDKDGFGDECDSDDDNDQVPDDKDNCMNAANPDQTNTDGDAFGNICELDDDNDGKMDTLDNCPLVANADQANIDNDQEGNACDCYDAVQGGSETGVDCGGNCAPCVQCTWCNKNVVPLRIKGDRNKGYMDIVFVGTSNVPNLQAAAQNAIQSRLLQLHTFTVNPLPNNYQDKYNFYIYTGGTATFGTTCDALKVPANYNKDVPFADVTAILTQTATNGFACALGPPTKFVAVSTNVNLITHENAHALFGLVDEYCGNTLYVQNDPNTNVWSSSANCQNDVDIKNAKFTQGSCTQIASGVCNQPWWRYDPDPNPGVQQAYMTCCPAGLTYQFGEAETRRIAWAFNTWPATKTRGVAVALHIAGDQVAYRNAAVVDGHPDWGMQHEDFSYVLRDREERPLAKYGFWDPRVTLSHPAEITDDIDFTLIVPFIAGLRGLDVYRDGNVIVRIDEIAPVIESFCAENPEAEECGGAEEQRPRGPSESGIPRVPRIATQPMGLWDKIVSFFRRQD